MAYRRLTSPRWRGVREQRSLAAENRRLAVAHVTLMLGWTFKAICEGNLDDACDFHAWMMFQLEDGE